jgi:ataxia telangiectasia mutated family protein
VSAWLLRVLDGLKAGGADQGDSYWTGMANDLARRNLDLACLALVVEGVFATNRIPSNKATVRAACDVLALLAPTLTLKKWLPHERAFLLGSLSPIFAEIPHKPDIEYPVLLDPGIASDLPRKVIPKRKQPAAQLDLDTAGLTLLRAIWRSDASRQALEEVLSALRFLLLEVTATESNASSKEAVGPSFAMSQAPSTQASERIKELEQTQNGDGFDDVKYGSSRALQLGSTGAATAPRAGAATVALCIKGFVSAEMASAGTSRPVRIQEVVDAILQSDGEESIVIAEQALAAVHAGLASFSLTQAQDILQHIGGELLPDYRYARNDAFATLAIKFLECTTDHWIVVNEANEDFAGNARTLSSWVIGSLREKKVSSWRVRLKVRGADHTGRFGR